MSSLSVSKMTHHPADATDVHDLDVTPVMNMFIILIPFLVSMAVFTQVSILSFSLPPNVGAGLDQTEGKPRIKLTVVVSTDFVAITHGDRMLDSVALGGEARGLARFRERLAVRRGETGIQDEVVVAVRDRVPFQALVRVMDICKETGFDKLGVSNATEDARKGV